MEVWEKLNLHSELEGLIDMISSSAANGQFAYVLGAGVSMVQRMPSWDKYTNDLIEYWKFHLEDISDEVENKYLLMLDMIKKSDENNKRKIDYVHQLIRDLGADEKMLQFEQMYFSKMQPLIPENEVIQKLIRVHAKFITTNYDSQIEKHLSNINDAKVQRTIRDLGEFFVGDKIPDVMHIHGSPDSKPENFVNSTKSYEAMYLQPNDGLESFKKELGARITTTLTVGSGLQEPEVLNIFSKVQTNYALMRVEDGDIDDPVVLSLLKLKSEMYMHNHKVKVIWYGTKFEDLPLFLDWLINKVFVTNNDATIAESVIKLHSTDEEFNEYVTKAFHSVSGQENIRDWLRLLQHGPKADETTFPVANSIRRFLALAEANGGTGFLERFPEIWNLLELEQFKYSNAERTQVLDYFKESDVIPFNFDIESVIDESDDYSESDVDLIYENLSKQNSVTYQTYIRIPEVLGWWILHQMSLDNMSFHEAEELNDDQYINFSSRGLRDFNTKETFKLYYTLEDLMMYSEFKILVDGFLKNHVLIDGVPFSDSDDKFIYKWPLIQRALIHVSLVGTLSERNLIRLIDELDFAIPNRGSEMNGFVEKYISEIKAAGKEGQLKNTYTDGVWGIDLETVREHPVFNRNEFEIFDVESLIKQINDSGGERDDANLFNLRTLQATANSLVSWASDKSMKGKMISFINALTDSAFEKLKEFVVELSNSDIEGLNVVAYQAYMEKYSKRTFDFYDEKFFENQLKLDEHKDEVVSILHEVEVNNLSVRSGIESPVLLTLSSVMNSDLGRYFLTYKSISTSNQTFILQLISGLGDEKRDYAEFFEGYFWNDISNDENEKPSLQNLIGYASRWYMSVQASETFKESLDFDLINEMYLNKNFSGADADILAAAISVILLEQINPDTVDLVPETRVTSRIMTTILFNDYEFKYEDAWIKWVSGTYEKGLYGYVFDQIRQNETNSKIDKILNLLEHDEATYKARLDLRSVTYQLKKYKDSKNIGLILRTLFDGVIKNKIDFSNTDEFGFEKLLNPYNEVQRKTLIDAMVKFGVITEIMHSTLRVTFDLI